MSNDITNFPAKRLNCILNLLHDEMKPLNDNKRDQPIKWSFMHVYSCSQLAKLLALRRRIDPEIAGIAGAIHDLAIIRTGIFENHGPASDPMIREFLENYNSIFGTSHGKLTKEEIEIIAKASIHHTEKTIFSENKFCELIKDVDSLDRFLHGKDTYAHYEKRTKSALEDLNLEYLHNL
ncbi:MAG: HD domain-containing protein [Candidatus Heimdallarchaeota archaeon]